MERRWRSIPATATAATATAATTTTAGADAGAGAGTGTNTRTGTGNAKGVRTTKGRVGELASLPCLLRPINHNPTGVAPRAGASADFATPLELRFCFEQTQGDTRVTRATLVSHHA
ncbi:MAG: hypothetical protein LBC18_12490 [Opitutaceae bacterium]|nr:hypothetical protein [Opitutaceae bacterium]